MCMSGGVMPSFREELHTLISPRSVSFDREVFFLSVDFADRTLMESYCIDTLRALLAVPCELCRNLVLLASVAHMAAVTSETFVLVPTVCQLTFWKGCSSLLHSTDLAEKYIAFATVCSTCDEFSLI